jgi:SpoIID/LytB domain protein
MANKIIKRGTIHRVGLFMYGLIYIAFFFINCSELPVFREGILFPQIKWPAVTVKLLETKESLDISSNGALFIRCFFSEGEPSIYYASAEMQIGLADGGITLAERTQGELENNLCKVLFSPKGDKSWIYLNEEPYRGALEVITSNNSESLKIFNLIHVEDYLKGVVPAEMGKLSKQEMEALKAQAIAARTYALSRLGRHRDKGYDLEATVTDQVYKGIKGEDALASLAVELTRGEVLTHDGKLICAYYHANSGGKTEFIEKVWDKPKKDYLVPVDDESFCSWSDKYKWQESWTKGALERNLHDFLATSVSFPSGVFGDLVNLKINKRTDSGRVEVLDIVTDWGSYRVYGDKIRQALRRGSNGNSILPSTCFDLEIERDSDGSIQRIIAHGRGNGHGVGMCQTGAIGMARKGYSYEDILTHYYSGAKLSKCYGKNKLQADKLTCYVSPSSCIP